MRRVEIHVYFRFESHLERSTDGVWEPCGRDDDQ